MKKPNITPGDWEATYSEEEGHYTIEAGGCDICYGAGAWGVGDDNDPADKTLIAAAPEGFEVLNASMELMIAAAGVLERTGRDIRAKQLGDQIQKVRDILRKAGYTDEPA